MEHLGVHVDMPRGRIRGFDDLAGASLMNSTAKNPTNSYVLILKIEKCHNDMTIVPKINHMSMFQFAV